MNAPVPLEATLSLYNDTACRDTGQYFCNSKPFSMPRTGNTVSMLPSGQVVLEKMHAAMMAAQSFIWIADWQMAFDVELIHRGDPGHPGMLHKVIESIIKRRAVHVRVLLYCSVKDDIPGTYDGMVSKTLNKLNKEGYPGSVHVMLQPPTSDQYDSFDYSHHQKFVVVDGRVGFLGGIDLSYGRWETPEFDVVVDPDRFLINEMYSPGCTKLRRASAIERRKIEEHRLAEPYGAGMLIDEGCQPRMPWQDVHIKVEGPSVVDIHRNFVRRWNSRLAEIPVEVRRNTPFATFIDKQWLEAVGGWSLLAATQPRRDGGAQVQIVRSVSRKHLAMEGDTPDDLQLYPDARERDVWMECLSAWRGTHQANILNAVVNCIRSADNYVYIETQFFISQFGTWGEKETGASLNGVRQKVAVVDSSKVGNEDDGVKNVVVDELAKRIDLHIKAATPFHVYIVIPTHPEGPIGDGSVWKQHWLALVSIKHGSNSLINRIKLSLQAQDRKAEEWSQYLTILNMRNYGATVQYARDPKTFNEDFTREIGRFVVTEQIYIHSKLLIVDDAVAIVGSANTNDRSLTGNGDTEIAAVVVDTEGVELRDLGSPNFMVQTRKFARELRRELWKKHFGFLAESVSERESRYFRSTERARRAGTSIPAPIEHPPRLTTTSAQITAASGIKADWNVVLDKPCHPDTVKAIQNIATHNARIYEEVFPQMPRNGMKTFGEIGGLYVLPYPATFDRLGTPALNQRNTLPKLANYNDEDLDRIAKVRHKVYADSIASGGKDAHFAGVVPPALSSAYMTKQLLPHQLDGLKEPKYANRQQVYADGTVHDVTKAINHLRKNVVGFFVMAPLDWGMGTEIKGDPTKHSTIDIAELQTDAAFKAG